MIPVGVVLALVGVWWVLAALKPRRRALALQARSAVWIRPRDLAHCSPPPPSGYPGSPTPPPRAPPTRPRVSTWSSSRAPGVSNSTRTPPPTPPSSRCSSTQHPLPHRQRRGHLQLGRRHLAPVGNRLLPQAATTVPARTPPRPRKRSPWLRGPGPVAGSGFLRRPQPCVQLVAPVAALARCAHHGAPSLTGVVVVSVRARPDIRCPVDPVVRGSGVRSASCSSRRIRPATASLVIGGSA